MSRRIAEPGAPRPALLPVSVEMIDEACATPDSFADRAALFLYVLIPLSALAMVVLVIRAAMASFGP